MKAKVTDALVEAVGSEARIELEDVAPDKVGGLVLSGSFADQSPTEGQCVLSVIAAATRKNGRSSHEEE